MTSPEDHPRKFGREPVLKAPWPIMVLVGALLGAYALQVALVGEAAYSAFGFSPRAYAEGRWPSLISALFVHGNLGHVLMNTAGALAFGTPVARLLGSGARGAATFFAFYLLCGAVANASYAHLHAQSEVVLVGASGAVFGLIGAATRILAGRGGLAPVFSPQVLIMSVAWIGVNLMVAFLGGAPGLGDQAIAWEAHIFGFAAGLLLIGPARTLSGGGRHAPFPTS